MKSYELIFENDFTLYKREYNHETKQSIVVEIPNTQGLPEVFKPDPNGEYISFERPNKPLSQIKFANSYEFYQFRKANQVMMDSYYGNTSRTQSYIRNNYQHQIGFDPQTKPHKFRTWFFDIEVRATNGYAKPTNPTEEISMIQIYDNFDDMYYIFAVGKQLDLGRPNILFQACETELKLLKGFKNLLQNKAPTILCGFNSDFFDIPYITNRCAHLGLDPKVFSPIEAITSSDARSFDGIEFKKYDWKGIITLDYRELYQKYTFEKLPKMSLETIAKHELGEGKVQHSEYDNLEDLYLNNYEKFVEYGLRDVEILVELDKKIKAIDTAKSIAYLCGVNIPEVFGTLFQWQSLMYNTAKTQNKILPLKQKYSEECPYVGGWVKASPGKHTNVFSFDFTSLYPSNIRTLSIGLDNYVTKHENPQLYKELEPYFNWYTMDNYEIIKSENDNKGELEFFKSLIENQDKIIPILQKYNVSIAPNGAVFRRESSILEQMMTKVFENRVKAKQELKNAKTKHEKEYWDLQQMVLKILMNSCYGSLALPYNNFSFGTKQSSAVTTTGRFVNRWVAYRVNQFLDLQNADECPHTVQADTDSNYFSLPSIDTLAKVEPIIQSAIKEVEAVLNVYSSNILNMEQENKFDIFLSFAPKRYIGRKYDNPGIYKFTGVSIVDKSTSAWSKEKLLETLPYIMEKTPKELVNFVEDIKDEFKNMDIEKISPIKGVNSLEYKESEATKNKFYNDKGNPAPFNSRGSIIHNRFIENKPHFDKIIAGDKVYMLYMKPCHLINLSNAFCFKNPKVVSTTELYKYIDWDKMFDKVFKDKLKTMTDPLGISLDPYQGQLDLWDF